MKTPRIDIGTIRRHQIVESAVAIIAEQGLQNLSLSQIEKKAGMSRGQLTYYFRAKEDILLAVFDRLLQLMYERIQDQQESKNTECHGSDGEWISHLLETVLLNPPASPAFSCLQYTFLSQMSHRQDFRERLARLYEEWRTGMAHGLSGRSDSPLPMAARTMASLVQGILHGLSMQLAADPQAFDREQMLKLCMDVLGVLFQSIGRAPVDSPHKARNGNGVNHTRAPVSQPRRIRSPRKKVSHE
ncbi:MAG: TetR/AcrR family transcriptional regulator [Gemmataceae bacterium]